MAVIGDFREENKTKFSFAAYLYIFNDPIYSLMTYKFYVLIGQLDQI
jgi:hypothetical protein